MVTLNCVGLPCPQPVLKCKEEIEKNSPAELTVIVDNEAAKENVSRFLKNQGFKIISVSTEGDNFRIIANATEVSSSNTKKMEQEDLSLYSCAIDSKEREEKQLVFITSDTIGRGDDILGKKLMINFLKTLPEMGKSLWRIIMVNSGVKLATEQGEALDALKKLEDMGVSILVCGTCLDFFNLLDKKKVGETTNMLDVVTSLQLATKVIKV